MDYDAIAKQYGGSSDAGDTDVSSLASKFGGTAIADSTQQSDQNVGFIKSLARGLWDTTGLGPISASLQGVGEEGKAVAHRGAAFFDSVMGKGDDAAAHTDKANALEALVNDQEQNGYDLGYMGTSKSLGKFTDPSSFFNSAISAAKLASFMAVPEAGAGKDAAQVAAEAASNPENISKFSSFLQKVTPWIQKNSWFAGLQGAAAGGEKLKEGESPIASGASALGNYALNLGGMLFFDGMNSLAKWGGNKLLSSDVVKTLNQKAIQFGDLFEHTLRNGSDSREVDALKQGYDYLHKQAVDTVGSTIKEGTDDGTLWQKIGGRVNTVVNSGYRLINQGYKDVYTPAVVVGRDALNATTKAMQDAVEAFRPGAGQSSFAVTGSPHLDNLLTELFSKVNKGNISLQDIGNLYRDYGLGSGNPVENKQIQNILHALTSDAKGYLSTSENESERALLDQWNEVSAKYKNLSQNLNGTFARLLQTTASPRNFVDKILTSSPTKVGQSGISQMLSGLDSESKDSLSSVLFDHIIDAVKQYSRNPEEGGKVLQNFLDKWQPTGLLNANHILQLDGFSKLMQQGYDGISSKMSEALGTPAKGVIDSARQASEGVAGAEAKQQLYQKALDSLKGSPLVKENGNGTLDFSNLLKTMKAVNENGVYDKEIANLQQLGNLSKVKSSAVAGLFKGTFGTGLVATGHPFIGASYIKSAMANLIGQPEEKISEDEISKAVGEIFKNPNTPETQKRILQFISGDYDQAFDFLKKVGTSAIVGTAGN